MRKAKEGAGDRYVFSDEDVEISGQLDLGGVDVGGTLQEHEERLEAVENRQQRADPDILDLLQAQGEALRVQGEALRVLRDRLEARFDRMEERFDRLEDLIRGRDGGE